jgi:hypothetical protein
MDAGRLKRVGGHGRGVWVADTCRLFMDCTVVMQSGEVARCPIGRAKPEEATHRQRFYKNNEYFR